MAPKRIVLRMASVFIGVLAFALTTASPSVANNVLQNVQHTLSQPDRLPLIVEKRRREISAFYNSEDGDVLWLDTGRAALLIDVMKSAHLHGLRSEDYPYELLETKLKSLGAGLSPSETAWVELLFTGHFLDFANDLRAGRVTPRVLYPDAYMPFHTINGTDALERLKAAENLAEFLSSWQPPDDTYRLLQTHLAHLYDIKAESGFTTLETDVELIPGAEGEGVQLLRRRLFEDNLLQEDTGSELFDKRLAFAVAQAKHRYVLPVSSEVTGKLVWALNLPIDRRIEQVSNAMERIRWVPPEFSRVQLFINKGENQFLFSENGRVVMEGAAYANCPDRNYANTATAVEAVTFHPTWQVPWEFLGKELLARLKNDPKQVESAGYYLRRSGADVPLASLPWRQATERSIKKFSGEFRLYLPSSEENPLGNYAFRLRQDQKLALFHLDSAPEDDIYCNPYLPKNAFGIVDGLDLLEKVIEPRVLPAGGLENRLARGDTITFPARSGLMAVATHQSVWIQHRGAIRFGHDPYLEDARLTAALTGRKKP
ncbi:hypothetical protein [Labrenzia sp. PHM005]|uniref:hypothetical protein n=1 Tax=Labrenzia sp. PHM005 TaxID=2590016 RepID=UPI0011404D2E|nr:hypothetical protein [Labrenzia sp. PHM005]QDG78702.1 hypothetical protein FJ695_24115 [Labrenzia sp. PHM005]